MTLKQIATILFGGFLLPKFLLPKNEKLKKTSPKKEKIKRKKTLEEKRKNITGYPAIHLFRVHLNRI